jgi:pterin-4a-carbinolamine dehydratase
VISDADVRARLADMPGWTLEDGTIVRVFRTTGWKSSLMVVNAVGYLAEAAWHHPDLAVSWGSVTVRLSTHDAGGITERDIELAGRIEALVGWRPDEGSALEGTPAGPPHAMLRTDG